MEKIVTGCGDCPFFAFNAVEENSCYHPTNMELDIIPDDSFDYKRDTPMWTAITPDNCPLKVDKITLIFSS